jgi:hypothetical protein
MGHKTEEQTMAYLNEERPKCHKDQSVTLYGGTLGDFEMFDIANKADMDYFRDQYNPNLIIGASKYFGVHDIENTLQVKCCVCKKEEVYYFDEWTTCDPHSEGGIVVTDHSIICRECDDKYRCFKCGEKYDENTVFDDEGNCPDCHETEIRHKQERLAMYVRENNQKEISYWNHILRCMMGLVSHDRPDCEGQMYFEFMK